MYEDLDSKLDEVSIGVVKIEEAAAAKIQEVTSSEKFNTRIEIQVRNGISDFLANNPEDLQKEIRKYIQKESPEQIALFDYVSDMVDEQIEEYIETDESNKLKLFCQRVANLAIAITQNQMIVQNQLLDSKLPRHSLMNTTVLILMVMILMMMIRRRKNANPHHIVLSKIQPSIKSFQPLVK